MAASRYRRIGRTSSYGFSADSVALCPAVGDAMAKSGPTSAKRPGSPRRGEKSAEWAQRRAHTIQRVEGRFCFEDHILKRSVEEEVGRNEVFITDTTNRGRKGVE